MTHNSTTAEMVPPGRQSAPRVLTVLPDFPFPATTGLHLRMVSNLELVRRLGCYSAVLYFSTEERDPVPLESTPLGEICDEVRHGGLRFAHARFSMFELVRHKLDFLVRGALGIPGRRYPFSMSYDRIGAAEIVLAEARRVGVDFVVLPSMLMHYTTALQRHEFRVIIDAADVLTNLTASFLRTANGRGGKVGLLANYLATRTQERLFLRCCNELWATSLREAQEFRGLAPEVRVVVVPNCLDEEHIRPSADSARPILGFVGTYSYLPNLEGVEFLAEEVFPRVRQKCGDAVLRVAGANMPTEVSTRLGKLAGVEILGRVADSGCFIDDCAVMALPIKVRGGVPLKLVEAMARGKAIVASPELVAGLSVADGRSVLVRSTAGDFANAIAELLANPGWRKELGTNARAAFLQDFSLSGAEDVLRRQSLLAKREAQSFQPPPA